MLFVVMSVLPADAATDSDQYRSIGPGFPGFLAMACLAIAVVFLIVSMARRIRRINYEQPVESAQADLVDQGEAEAIEREARRRLAELRGEQPSPDPNALRSGPEGDSTRS